MQIENYKVKALHTFQVGTINKLGFWPRVSLVNNSHNLPKFKTDYLVYLTIIDSKGQSTCQKLDLEIPMGQKAFFDCKPLIKDPSTESIFIFHLIPKKYANQVDGVVSTSREELWGLLTAQDHYVEFYNDTGFSSGVLYQSGAFNYSKFSGEKSVLIQCPKCYFSRNHRTYMQFTHTSFEDNYQTTAELKCVLVDSNGKKVAQWAEKFPPNTTRLVNIADKVDIDLKSVDDLSPVFYCLYAVSSDAILLPLTMSQNIVKNTLAVEHSLPPNYYGSTFYGPTRKQTIGQLVRDFIF